MPGLDETVRRMLASETFEPDELKSLLVSRGEDESAVTAAIEGALATGAREVRRA